MMGQHQDNQTQDHEQNDAQENKTTDLQAMMHILKANVAVGVLAMPSAFKFVGLWFGFILIPLIGATCIHCMNILIQCHNHLCDKFNYEALDYDQVAALGLACGPKLARRVAKRAHVVVLTLLMFTQIGFCCVYILFVVENIQISMLSLFQLNYPTTTYMLLIFPVIWLTSCTSNLSHLAAISTLANFMQLSGLSLIFFDLLSSHTYTGILLPSEAEAANGSEPLIYRLDPPIEVDRLFSKNLWAGLPLFFATAVYAFEGIGVVLPVLKEMRHPSRISGLNGVLNTSMSLVAILYMGMGFFGYAKYGQYVEGSITFNLPKTTLFDLVRLIFAAAIGLSYSLQFYVPWAIMWPFIDETLFYSYRPREQRDKLDILKKLSPDNEWALLSGTGSERSVPVPNDESADSDQPAGDTGESRDGPESATGLAELGLGEGQTSIRPQPSFDLHSTATTFATSYAMSTYLQQPAFRGLPKSQAFSQPQVVANNNNGNSNNNPSALLVTDKRNQHLHYGSMDYNHGNREQQALESAASPAHPDAAQHQQAAINRSSELNFLFRGQQKRRNRYAEFVEADEANRAHDDEEQMPEVEWRPPPKSMRGLRKLVRYTVILLTVSFTFVAAALIPRLDLFISLIGALSSSCLAIVFPAIIHTCTFWNFHQQPSDEDEQQDNPQSEELLRGRKRRAWYFFLTKNSLLVLFGIVGLITGSWVSLAQLLAAV